MPYKNKNKKREYEKKYSQSLKGKLARKKASRKFSKSLKRKQYETLPKVKAYRRKYNKSPKAKASKRKWKRSRKGKLYLKKYSKSQNAKTCREKYHRKLKNEVLLIYSPRGSIIPECCCCREKILEFLTLDHINGGGKKERKKINNMTFYRWVKINQPKNLQTLCMNCNWGSRFRKECPHKMKRENNSYGTN